MLNRYENECRKLGLPEYGMNRLTDSGIPNDAKAVLESAATSLQTAEATIENTKNSIAKLCTTIDSAVGLEVAC